MQSLQRAEDRLYSVPRAWSEQWKTASYEIWLLIKQNESRTRTRGDSMIVFTYVNGCHVEQVVLCVCPQEVKWEDCKKYILAYFSGDDILNNRLGYTKWPLVVISIVWITIWEEYCWKDLIIRWVVRWMDFYVSTLKHNFMNKNRK